MTKDFREQISYNSYEEVYDYQKNFLMITARSYQVVFLIWMSTVHYSQWLQ